MAGKMGKMGILWEIDRTTGAFVAAHDLGYQTLIDVDPQTGEVTYRPGMIPQAGVELEFCPDFRGIRNWPASAYHPQTQLLYIPIHPTCVRGTFTEIDRVLQAPYYPNSGWRSQGTTAHPDSPDHRGHLVAMDINSGEIVWRHPRARPRAGQRSRRAAAWWSVLTPTAICTFTTPPLATSCSRRGCPPRYRGSRSPTRSTAGNTWRCRLGAIGATRSTSSPSR